MRDTDTHTRQAPAPTGAAVPADHCQHKRRSISSGGPGEVPRVSYRDARARIFNGDLLSFTPRWSLWRPWTLWTWLIALSNRHRTCHSAMAAWWGNNLLCVQMAVRGQRVVRLSQLVRRWPGKITVSRARTTGDGFDTAKAVEAMVRIASRPYGFWRLFSMALSHTLLGLHLCPPSRNDWEKSNWPPVCSQSYSMACRSGRFDPCPHRADNSTEPSDLFDSPAMHPLFTLV